MNSIDELMWLIADEGDVAAIDSFSRRHPEHHSELMRRINMVREIKGTRPETPEIAIPAFTPRNISEPRRTPRWFVAVAAGAILVGSAFAGYYGIGMTRKTPTDPQPITTANNSPGSTSIPNFNHEKLSPSLPPGFDPNQNVVPPQPRPEVLAAWQKPVTLQFKSISIVEIFNEITRQTGLKIEIGPGLLPADVPIDLTEVSAIAALKGLGEMYGFTVFEQDEHSVLIIPAVDPTQYPATSPEEDSREGTPPTAVEDGGSGSGSLPEATPRTGELPAVSPNR